MNKHICMYIYIYIHMCIYIYVFMYKEYICIHIYVRIHMYVYISTHIKNRIKIITESKMMNEIKTNFLDFKTVHLYIICINI
jgi:hypothetical protein